MLICSLFFPSPRWSLRFDAIGLTRFHYRRAYGHTYADAYTRRTSRLYPHYLLREQARDFSSYWSLTLRYHGILLLAISSPPPLNSQDYAAPAHKQSRRRSHSTSHSHDGSAARYARQVRSTLAQLLPPPLGLSTAMMIHWPRRFWLRHAFLFNAGERLE